MKTDFLLSALILIFGLIPTTVAHSVEKLETVPSVDLYRYMGTWYEIAKIPQWFQRKCVRDTKALYGPMPFMMSVENTCTQENGEIKQAHGAARIDDPAYPAKLSVTFVKIFKWIFSFSGDYWIIQLDDDYKYAVVGHPNRTYGWILSRTPALSKALLTEIESKLKNQGYDTCLFTTSIQTGGILESIPLCEWIKK